MKLYVIVIMHLTRDGSALYSSCSATEYVRSGTRFVTWIILDHSKIGEKTWGVLHLSSVHNPCIIPLNPGWLIGIPRSWIIVIPNI